MRRRPPSSARPARRLLLSLAVLCLAAPVAFTVHNAAQAAGLEDGLALWYKLDAASGTAVTDSSGKGRDGTVNGTATWGGAEGLGFNGTDTFVKVPDNVLAGLDSVTVSMDVFVASDQAAPYFIYGFGNSTGGVGNGYLFSTGDGYRTSIATGNWSTEQTVSAGRNLTRGVWKHVAYTLGGTTAVLYEDGSEAGRNAAVTITPAAIGSGATTANAIGRSVYAPDRLFKGKIRDFRLYDRALTRDEVEQLALPVSTRLVEADRAALDLGDTDAVVADLTLPASGASGSAVTWSSSNPAVVTAAGVVTRPAGGQPAASATLTATLVKGAARATRTFPVTVLAQFTDKEAVKADAAALVVHNVEDVRGNLTLPTRGPNGSTVTWASDRRQIITATGVVKRPAKDSAEVKLTATVTKGRASARRTFEAVVRERPTAQKYEGYAFSYFTGEGTPNGEQVYFAASQGNDPLHWKVLNNGQPTMTSTLGDKGVRDPFVIRSPEGDRFYLIATDLKIHGNWAWDRSQRQGSRAIMVWESTDMVTWSQQRMVTVAPPEAGNTWAPEVAYDTASGDYIVFWASKIYAANDPGHTGDTYNKMMYARTRDFHTFSAPAVYLDKGFSTIDTTMISHAGRYYRLTKDERNNSPASPNGKFLFQEVGDSVLDQNFTLIKEGVGKGQIGAGEGPTIFKSNTEEKWYLFIDEFSGRGYVPFETTDLNSGNWTLSTGYALPTSPRHGTVLPVTRAEHARMSQTAPQVCTRSITGVHRGPLEVTAGVVCLTAATVKGDVTVSGGASLVVTGGRIQGDLDATAARVLSVIDAEVDGAVSVTGTTGWVRLSRTTVDGPVFLAGTTGQVAPDLTRSRVKGLLYCHGNAVAPELTDLKVSGTRYGQCARS